MTRDEQPKRMPPCPPPEKIEWGTYTMSRDAEYARSDERKPAKVDRSQFWNGFWWGALAVAAVGLVIRWLM